MTSTINIRSGDDLRKWLEAHAGDELTPWARLLAQRAALRVFPLVISVTAVERLSTHQKQALTLSGFRANIISSLADTWPSDDMADAVHAAVHAAADAADAADAAYAGHAAAGAAYAGHAAADAADAVHAAVNAAVHAAAGAAHAAVNAAAHAAHAAVNAALSADCQMLMQSGADALKNAPLWMTFDDADDGNPVTVTPPKEIIEWMDRLPLLTDILGPNAGLIDAWYQPLFTGQPPRFNDERARDFFLEHTSDDFWEITDARTGEDIMNDISAGLGWEPEAYVDHDDAADDVEIAPQKPATLEPEWSDERLTLPARPLADDFNEGDMNDALQALKTVLEGFSADVLGSNNIDQRIVRYLSDLAHNAPVQVPDQAEFFVFSHNETVLSGLVPTAEREWDGLLAARLAAISLQFADTVRKFPAWRAFRRSVPDEGMSPEDVAAAENLSHVLAEALREDFAAEFVDRVIPDTLDDIADDIPDVQPVTADDHLVTEQTRAQTHDLLESINNILKPIMAGALLAKGKAGELGAVTWERLSKGIRAEYGDQTEQLGRQVVKLGFWLLKYVAPPGIAAAVGGKPLVVWLLSTFPTHFKWLEPVAKILGVIG